MNRRRAEARLRLLTASTVNALSDVFHDAAEDGIEGPDGEGGTWTPDHGYDCDDLAAVLMPMLDENDRLRNALRVAHDFIAYHPAVQGRWPLVLNVVDEALASSPPERVPKPPPERVPRPEPGK